MAVGYPSGRREVPDPSRRVEGLRASPVGLVRAAVPLELAAPEHLATDPLDGDASTAASSEPEPERPEHERVQGRPSKNDEPRYLHPRCHMYQPPVLLPRCHVCPQPGGSQSGGTNTRRPATIGYGPDNLLAAPTCSSDFSGSQTWPWIDAPGRRLNNRPRLGNLLARRLAHRGLRKGARQSPRAGKTSEVLAHFC